MVITRKVRKGTKIWGDFEKKDEKANITNSKVLYIKHLRTVKTQLPVYYSSQSSKLDRILLFCHPNDMCREQYNNPRYEIFQDLPSEEQS